MTELKSCPFCGKMHKVVTVQTVDNYDADGNPVMGMKRECINLTEHGSYLTVEKWQSRPIEDALQSKLNALETELKLSMQQEIPEGYWLVSFGKLKVERDALQAKLDIAVEALKLCAIPYPYPEDKKQCDIAFDALKKIGEDI